MSVLKSVLNELRRDRKMQRAELAALVGVWRETIVNLEAGRYNPSYKLAVDIAHVFGKNKTPLPRNWTEENFLLTSTHILE